jgi:hypothetical protein
LFQVRYPNLFVDADLPLVRAVHASNHAKQGRLAASVTAQKAKLLALIQTKRQILKQNPFAKAFTDRRNRENIHGTKMQSLPPMSTFALYSFRCLYPHPIP